MNSIYQAMHYLAEHFSQKCVRQRNSVAFTKNFKKQWTEKKKDEYQCNEVYEYNLKWESQGYKSTWTNE